METKEFHLGDVLSVILNRLVSPNGLDGYYGVIDFMVGRKLFTNQIPKAAEICRQYLVEQFPRLGSPEVTVMAAGELILMLETESGKAEPYELMTGWLAKLASRYGETFQVAPLPEGAYQEKDPVEELMEDAPDMKIIPILTPS